MEVEIKAPPFVFIWYDTNIPEIIPAVGGSRCIDHLEHENFIPDARYMSDWCGGA